MNTNKRQRRQYRLAWLFLFPSVSGMGVFYGLPFMDVVRRSFLDAMGQSFTGLDNYRVVWNNQAFRLAFGNTFRFLAVAIPLLFIVSLVLALLVYRAGLCRQWFKASLMLPMAVPAAAIALAWKILLCPDGCLNQFLTFLTGEGWGRDWVNGDTAFPILVGTYLWKNIGYDMLLWLAGLSAVPEGLYDAAKVDGAGVFARIRHISLPNLGGAMAMVLVLSLVNSFRVYREADLLAGAYPEAAIYLIPHLFGHWFLNLDVQKMCTGAMFLLLAFLPCFGAAKAAAARQRKA